MHMVVNTLCKTLYKGQPELVVKVLDYSMSLRLPEVPSQKDYTESLKTFEGARLGEMHRIAFSFADYLLVKYIKVRASTSAANNTSGRIFRPRITGEQHDPVESKR